MGVIHRGRTGPLDSTELWYLDYTTLYTGYTNSEWIPIAMRMLARSDLVVLLSELWQELKSVHAQPSSFQIVLVCGCGTYGYWKDIVIILHGIFVKEPHSLCWTGWIKSAVEAEIGWHWNNSSMPSKTFVNTFAYYISDCLSLKRGVLLHSGLVRLFSSLWFLVYNLT